MTTMRPSSGVSPGRDRAERGRQVKFLRWFRETTQYTSLTFRPQFLRQRWMVEEQRWRGKEWWKRDREWWR